MGKTSAEKVAAGPAAQVQLPPAHCWPGAHTTPQPPQFSKSVEGSVQSLSQRASGASQVGVEVQPPATHVSLAAQALPQPPQCISSVSTSAQWPVQSVSPPGHAATQL